MATGYSSLLVCLLFGVCEPGYHSTAFAAWIASTQQVVSSKSGRFDVKASLLNKS